MKPFALERYFSEHEFRTKWLLGSSDPESMTIEELLSYDEKSIIDFSQIWLGYTEYFGDAGLRNEISKLYCEISKNQILVFSGAEEPIYTFMSSIISPGDHIIVHFPSYQSHYSIAESRSVEVSRWVATPEKNWVPDIDELFDLVKPNTKAIVISTPHNPTGYHFDLSSLNEIIAIARKKGIYLLCDEVYRGTEHNLSDRLPNLADLYENGISINGLSKNCGLAGLRIGWIATQNMQVFSEMSAFKDYLTISNSAPSEFLAKIAIKNFNTLCDRTMGFILNNLLSLESFFDKHKNLFLYKKPIAGTTVFPAFLAGDAFSFCNKLLIERGIMLVPGTFFEMQGEYIRFGYGRANIPKILNLLENWLEDYIPAT